MLISIPRRYIYVGINKTGSSSIEAVLGNNLETRFFRWLHGRTTKDNIAFKHIPARTAKSLTGPLWNACFTFTFVRDPWARTLSEYTRHRHDPALSIQEGFTRWVRSGGNWLARENNMRDFVCDDDGHCLLDFVGRIEQDWPQVAQRLGLNTLPRKNRSASISLAEAYTPETLGHRARVDQGRPRLLRLPPHDSVMHPIPAR